MIAFNLFIFDFKKKTMYLPECAVEKYISIKS